MFMSIGVKRTPTLQEREAEVSHAEMLAEYNADIAEAAEASSRQNDLFDDDLDWWRDLSDSALFDQFGGDLFGGIPWSEDDLSDLYEEQYGDEYNQYLFD